MKTIRITAAFALIALIFTMAAVTGAATVPSVNSIIINPNQPYQTSIWTDKSNYNIGDKIGVGFRVNRDSYAYIFSIDAEGAVRMIFPNIYSNDNWVKANLSYRLPDNDKYSLTIGGPKGTDQIVLISTPDKIRDTDWLARSLSNNNFAPQININITADGFMAQIKSVVITPTFQSNWSSAYALYTIGGIHSLVEPPSVSSIIVTPPAITPPAQNNGRMYITSNPSGAMVFLNGHEVGKTPINVTQLNYGEYEVTLILSNYYSYASRLVINSSNVQNINAWLTRVSGSF
jgi:hypothetical protein